MIGLITAGASLLGGILGSNSQKKAAQAQAASADRATAEQARQFDITRADYAPWREAGVNALATLQDPNAYQQSPGFNFLQQQGMRGIERSAAARGGATSGNALQALAQFNQGLAQQDYGNWWNRQANIAGIGQAATNSLAALGANYGNNAAGNMMAAGDARASGIVGSANSLSQGLAGAANALQYFNRPQMGSNAFNAAYDALQPVTLTATRRYP